MITKSEWQAVNRQLMAEDRQRLGEPPTAEEILAYTRGELSPEDETRVRERLVCHPDLVRALAVPFPAEPAKPGDPDYLSEDEFAKHWEVLQKRMRPHRVVRFPHAWTAIAAACAIVFGALFWQAEWRARRLAKELNEPRVAWEEYVLPAEGQRGGGNATAVLPAEGDTVLLRAPVYNQPHYAGYRLEIVDPSATPPRVLWSSTGVRRSDDDTFDILVPRAFLRPGRYQVVLYGVDRAREERLMSYTLRVAGH